MKQMTSGKLALVGVFALAGCYSYASEAINNANYNTVQATPQFAVMKVGDSDQLIMRLVNDANNGAVTSYTVSNVGAGVAVHYQTNYRPVFDSKLDTLVATGDKTAQQYFIVGLAVGTYSFTVTPTSVNTGISATVNVVVTPRDLGPAISKTSGAAGDTIVITAPTNTVFSQTSAVSFTTGVVGIASRSADSTSIKIVVGGGVTGPATVTLVGNKLVPTVLPVTLSSTNSLVTTPQAQPTLSASSAAAGATITLTAGANTFFSPTSVVSFGTGSISVTSRAADSSSISFLVGPGITGNASVTLVGLRSAKTLATNSLNSTNALTTTALTVAPTTLGSAAPALGTSTTVALGSGLRFLGNSHIFVGGAEAGIVSTSADSSTATIVPMTGSTGVVSYTNIALSFLTSVPLALPGDQSMTVGSVYSGPTDANATSATTASTITLTGARSTLISDGGALSTACPASLAAAFGGSSCRYYKITLAAGTATARIKWNAGAVSDLGLFLVNAAGTTCVATLADNNGQVAGSTGDNSAQPLNCAESANLSITAGTYILTVVEFNYGVVVVPAWYQFIISQP